MRSPLRRRRFAEPTGQGRSLERLDTVEEDCIGATGVEPSTARRRSEERQRSDIMAISADPLTRERCDHAAEGVSHKMYRAVSHPQDTLGGVVDMLLKAFARTIAVASVTSEIERKQLPTVV